MSTGSQSDAGSSSGTRSSTPASPTPSPTLSPSVAPEPCKSDPIFARPSNDIVLRSTDNRSFRFERAILTLQSPVFEELLATTRSTKRIDGLPVLDVDTHGDNLESLLRYIHPKGQTPRVEGIHAIQLCVLADKYKVRWLVVTVVSQIALSLLEDGWAEDLLGLALVHRLPAFVVLSLRALDDEHAGKFHCALSEMMTSLPGRIPFPTLYLIWQHMSIYGTDKGNLIKEIQRDPGFFDEDKIMVKVRAIEAQAQERRRREAPPPASHAGAYHQVTAPTSAATAAAAVPVGLSSAPAAGSAAASAAPLVAPAADVPPTADSPPPAPAPVKTNSTLLRWLVYFAGDAALQDGSADLALRSADFQAFSVRRSALEAQLGREPFQKFFAADRNDGGSRKRVRLEDGGAEIIDLPSVPGRALEMLLLHLSASVPSPPRARTFKELEQLCALANAYGTRHVATLALARDGSFFLTDHAPEILALAIAHELPTLTAAALRAFDNPRRGSACACCAGAINPRWLLEDIPFDLVARMPFPIFLRLLRRQSYFLEEEYDYGTDWTDFAAGLETDPNWFDA